MKKFLYFLIITLAVVLISDSFIGYYLDHHFALTSFEPAHQAYNNTSDLALMGPSEMQNQYVTTIISDSLNFSAYNYGSSAGNIYSSYILLNLMLNHSKHKPKYILYEPSYIDFYDTPKWNTEQLDVFYPMYNIDDSLRSVVDLQGWQTSLMLSTLQSYKHNSKIYDYIKQMFRPVANDENLGFHAIKSKEFNDSLEVVKDAPNIKIDKKKIEYFYRFIHLCKDNNIKLILVNAPSYEIHEDVMWMKLLKSIVKEEEIPFLNYDNDTFFTSHKEFYYNRGHFNGEGATIWTKSIIKDLRVLIHN